MLKMNKSDATIHLIDVITTRLEADRNRPLHCDLSRIGPLHLASLYSNENDASVISAKVQCGMDTNQDLAILKALVEHVERIAYNLAVSREKAFFSSDGFAAYPRSKNLDFGEASARRNALNEAIERYVWATWWDERRYGHALFEGNTIPLDSDALATLEAISEILPIRQPILVQPFVKFGMPSVRIFFLYLACGGVLSGGACEQDVDLANSRALGELARHAAAGCRLMDGAAPTSFYEKRLAYMLTPAAGVSLTARLSLNGQEIIDLPELAVDSPVKHGMDDLIAVHRCLFANQPPFVGGPLERLCL